MASHHAHLGHALLPGLRGDGLDRATNAPLRGHRLPEPLWRQWTLGPDEEVCKDPAVQDMVNELFGWQLFFDGIPGLLMAMYYGAMADEKGRKPVLMLSLVGQALGAAWILLICMFNQATC